VADCPLSECDGSGIILGLSVSDKPYVTHCKCLAGQRQLLNYLASKPAMRESSRKTYAKNLALDYAAGEDGHIRARITLVDKKGSVMSRIILDHEHAETLADTLYAYLRAAVPDDQ